MKKKLLLSIVMLFALSVFMVRVDANTYYPLTDDLPAKAPEAIPADDSTVKVTVDGGFDLSPIKFPKSGGGTVNGMHLRKIIIGTQKDSLNSITSGLPDGWTSSNKTTADFVNNLFSNWFTAYCLDSTKDYPIYGIFGFDEYEETTASAKKANDILRVALLNDDGLKSMFNTVESKYNGEKYVFTPVFTAEEAALVINDKDANNNRFSVNLENTYYYSSTYERVGYKLKLTGTPTTGSVQVGQYTCLATSADATCTTMLKVDEANASGYYVTKYHIDAYTLDENIADQLVLDYENNPGREVTFKVAAIRFYNPLSSSPTIIDYVANDSISSSLSPSAAETYYLDSDHTITNATIKTDIKKTAFMSYVAKDDRSISNYNHALWIVEHSYPTLSIDDALTLAGVDKTKLDNQLKTLYSISGTDEAVAALLLKTKQNVVYGVTQYAIWATVGNKVKDDDALVYLGKTMDMKVGTEDFELNKLFNYYLQERAEYTGYSDPQIYSNTITLTTPEKGKEYVGETTDGYLYGPYKASYNAPVETTAKIQIEITNTDKTGIKVLGSDKKTDITSTGVAKGEEFYIEVGKKASVGNVTFTLKLEGVKTFIPSTNRGRVYYATNSPSTIQNAMSGGKITTETIRGDFSVLTNAKTGVENVAMLLMVTLVAFTLGYLVLSYKNKPIQLS